LTKRGSATSDAPSSPAMDDEFINLLDADDPITSIDMHGDSFMTGNNSHGSPHHTGTGINEHSPRSELANEQMVMDFDMGANEWLENTALESITGTVAPHGHSQGDSIIGRSHMHSVSPVEDLVPYGTSLQHSHVSVRGENSSQGADIPALFSINGSGFPLNFSDAETFIHDTSAVVDAESFHQEQDRNSKITLSVETCDRDSLDQLLGVARTVKGKVKMVVEY
jgi:hypothetical protein